MGICTAPPPADGCDFEHAVEGAQTGINDNVIVAPGFYAESDEITPSDSGLTVNGAGSPATTLSSTAPNAFQIAASTVTVRGMRILHSGINNGFSFGVAAENSVGERLSVSTIAGGSACRFVATGATAAILRDSVCRNTSAAGVAAIQVDPNASPTATIRNVTAYATGPFANGLFGTAQVGGDPIVNVRNSILRATSPAVDVYAISPGAGHTITIDLDFSSYADTTEDDNDANTSITAAGSLSNIVSLPVFDDTDTNFHQAAGAPTIDKGSAGVTDLGALDLDGDARSLGSAPDIGADEFVPPVSQAPSTAAAPAPVSTPAKKKCKKGFKLKKGKCRRKKRKRR